ncbi:MAG: hypothetical protein LZ158_01490 [Thaumarchaeota archaeon]|jgi:hypothetical protein|nr:hypothetical protein [Candidatus Terraquivivens yellowstonensis]MCL7392474.1 hypothetical protein [Candidatus Terraquivivens yellowstonensis]MCL7394673.1 hypothetical protein [Candidatus Terraquivivens yellowstonensis]MCL7398432.1 hypothetical protein [Candidatus Terraquivivens yellowstonensis]MCL7399150.1 hypothetical protein [Candidatus Terraquivivens yellowstonensis]
MSLRISILAAGFREIFTIVVLFLIFLVTLMVVVALAAFLKELGAEISKYVVDVVLRAVG